MADLVEREETSLNLNENGSLASTILEKSESVLTSTFTKKMNQASEEPKIKTLDHYKRKLKAQNLVKNLKLVEIFNSG